MKIIYNEKGLLNLFVVKESKRWMKQSFIRAEQFEAIRAAYPSPFYHPNFLIRLLMFVAGLLAVSGASGIFFMMVVQAGVTVISVGTIVFGVATYLLLAFAIIREQNHYKSGLTEALLYSACGFVIAGIGGITSFDNIHIVLVVTLVITTYAAIRFADLISTTVSLGSFAGLLFYECYNAGGLLKQLIPFVFIAAFSIVFFAARRMRKHRGYFWWFDNLLLIEYLCLLLVYAGGNYLVVRELSISLMDLSLEEGQDIPFAFLFYGFTVIFPLMYLYFGIKDRDVVLLRVSLIVLAFTVFTFKYYYGFGHPEITLTIAGILLLGVAGWLFNYLKVVRGGFTRENLLEEKWGNANIAAFVMSQTLGGNVKAEPALKGGGGEFGGGGASGGY